MKKILTLALLCVCAGSGSAQSDKPLLLQSPALSKSRIAFTFAGDLWVSSREGGEATRLTTGLGFETNPIFSPDGELIAFTGQYDGNTDVFVVPASGGSPRRLTYHPAADIAVAWTPDGKNILLRSSRASSSRFQRFFTIPAEGGFETEVPLPMADDGAYSPDGAKLAYTPIAPAFAQWKNYRGGRATKIWIANLSDSSVTEIPRQNSNDFNPMWPRGEADKVYFLSDRQGRFTLFNYDTKTKRVTQLIKSDGPDALDIKSASAGPDAIVYEQFGVIGLYDLKTGQTSKVNITLNADLPSVRPRYERAAGRIANIALSPTGARAVFEARGEIISAPADKGNARNLTNSPGVADRDPAWSPDGRWIAYFSDESGEYALHLSPQSGLGEVKKINLGVPPSYFYSPVWSPDGKKIAYTDKRLNLWYVDIEKGAPVKVDTNTYENPWRVMDPDWSPDSKWISYTKQLKNRMCAVFIHSLESGKSSQVTDGMSDARFANFDKNGKYLYFTASTNAGPATGWLDMSAFPHQTTRSVYVVVLKKGEASPLAPESDEEKAAEEKKDGEKAIPPKPGEKKEPPKVIIDFEGVGQRILALPIPARSYVGMGVAKPGVIFIAEGAGGLLGGGAMTIHKFELEKKKFDKVQENVTAFTLSANGEKMLVGTGMRYTIMPTMTPARPGEGAVKIEDMEVYVDPKAEWKQMYDEAWRIQRDFFYDPKLHGLDYEGTKKRYEAWLGGVAHRADLNYLFREMLGNMSVGHHNSGGGDAPQPNFVPTGLLGCDFKVENGRYRFAKIYDGENWNPQLRAPLTEPGVEVNAGDYLIAVNGRDVRSTENVHSFFESKANKQVLIKVSASADGSNAREYTVVPVGNETGLRNLDWIEGNRRKVDQLSGGKLAYVYLPDTAAGGYTNFNRYYFSQIDKDGAVIDERFNGGGTAADYIIDYMRRPLMNRWATREGEDFSTPSASIYGPKVMIINEYAGSGGDLMPWLFRKAGIGPTVGKRTWGGLVGIYDYPQLIDGGSVTAPRVAFYNLQGEWDVENYGTPADVDVDFDPAAWRQGKDTQLEKAIQVAMDLLKKNPPLKPKKPAYPDYNNGTGPVAKGKDANRKTAAKAAGKGLKASNQR
ncbi:MAG TPA: PDZ domain-containing protein [Blastocatellia bacterium]|jgi:tricorn protease|nr:PDZ domain-containing protein [Blastocatellia bacterium]